MQGKKANSRPTKESNWTKSSKFNDESSGFMPARPERRPDRYE